MLILPIGLIIVTASMLRVAFGRHFFSDVVLGALLTLVVFCLLAWACEYLARGSRALSPR
ncbi:membrane-associated phospholipid phosphatase [Aminobacter aganoensis]|uniref:Membrane-associated phospholipid phosphatase n=2 Tax=Aminobacter aganoensis TaxID=83264 RepID=A0A7X0KI60_9HYPH|nr:membrane-associated phospholipid phosphatase [Aminobacter aganoensis]